MKKRKQVSSHQRKDDSWKKYTKKYEPIVRTSEPRRKKRRTKSVFGRILDYALLYGLPLFIYLAMLAAFLGGLAGGIYLFCKGEGDSWLGGVLCFAVAAMALWALWQCFGVLGFIMESMIRSESYYEEHSGYILEDLKRLLHIKRTSDTKKGIAANGGKPEAKDTKQRNTRESDTKEQKQRNTKDSD